MQHHENMEAMACSVVSCLRHAKFNGKSMICHRGMEQKCFHDESNLKKFLSLTEEQKQMCGWKYKPCVNRLTMDLKVLWNAPMDDERLYFDDYKLINNIDVNTAWKDKYSTTLTNQTGEFYETQPIPDYIRWFHTSGELHYCSTNHTQQLTEQLECLQQYPAIFLPGRILSNCFQLSISPPESVLQGLALLTWLPVTAVRKKFEILRERMEKEIEDSRNRDAWSQHELYKKNVEQLKTMCKKRSLSCDGIKYELVRRLADEPTPTIATVPSLHSLPKSLTSIRKLSVFQLKYMLNSKGICSLGNKDDLILRVFLLRNGRSHAIGENERADIKKTIQVAEECICEQQKEAIVKQINRIRKFSSQIDSRSKIPIPINIKSIKELSNIFFDLKLFLNARLDNEEAAIIEQPSENVGKESLELFFEIGSVVKVKVTSKDSPLGLGWFTGSVQCSDLEMDEITVSFFEQPDHLLSIEVTPCYTNKELILITK